MQTFIPTTDLTEETRREICAMLMVSCSRAMAADFVGCPPEAILELSKRNVEFAGQLRRAEVNAELNYLRAVHEACKDPKNWRAAQWMLERRYPERYGKRGPDVVTQAQMSEIIQQMADIILAETPDEDLRERILKRFEQAVASRRDDAD